MNILCIDTSGQNIGITAKGETAVFTSVYTSVNRRVNSHAAFVLPLIEEAVEHAGFKVDETELIICPQGPGSFTGLRLAYSVAKALELKTQAKLYSVPILTAIAFKYGKNKEQFLSIIDAKRDCFYTQAFKNGKELSEAEDIPAVKALEKLKQEKQSCICGMGTEKFQEDIAEEAYNSNTINYIEFDMTNLSKLMLEYYEAGNECVEVKEYDGPMYIRKSDAEK